MKTITRFSEAIRQSKKLQYGLLAFVVAIGIFLRTYHFQSWMEFSPDQARDATLIGHVLSGKESLPLLGAESGNTHFRLGPIAYHWQYVSGLLFGPEPYRLAYPDLLFSIAAIVLFFFVMKRYFEVNISLLLTTIFSVSFFIIKYSRFAWNPNSTPFFTLLFLFALLTMLDPKEKGKFLSPVLLGVAMGVGVQLHTLLIFILPTVAGIIFLLLYRRSLFSWKSFVLVLSFFLLMNGAQIYHEVNRNFSNTNLFLKALTGTSSGSGSSMGRNASLASACEIQSSVYMLSSWGDIGKCVSWKSAFSKSTTEIKLVFFFGLLFAVGGFGVLGYVLKKEKDERRRDFLLLTALYAGVAFLVSIPVITQVSVRYYITSFFVPFALLGLWLEFFLKKASAIFIALAFFLVALVLWGNIRTISALAGRLNDKTASDSKTVFYGELDNMVRYIEQSAPQEKTVLVSGSRTYMSRFFKPLDFVAESRGTNFVNLASVKESPAGKIFFYIDKAVSESKLKTGVHKKHPVLEYGMFGQVMILKTEKE